MKTVVVIGSNSFSGADFVDLVLAETEHRVVGVSRSPEKSPLFLPYLRRPDRLARFAFHQLDLNRDMRAILALLAELRPAYIVNFAAQSEVAPSWKNPDHWFQTNAVAVATLGNFLKDQSWLENYVHISSPEVYGTCEGTVREDAPVDPSTPYAASKAAGDLMLFTLVKNFGFPLTMIRATNVYGEGQQLFKIIPRSAIYLKLSRPIELHGGGHAIKSYIHIRDVSRAELAVMERGAKGGIYHVSPDRGVAVRDVVRALCDACATDFDRATRVVAERLGQDRAYVIDSSKLRETLGWKPAIDLATGIARVVAWVTDNWAEIQGQPLDYVHKP
jgi:dTDP-glucose 4,6-dehydratase